LEKILQERGSLRTPDKRVIDALQAEKDYKTIFTNLHSDKFYRNARNSTILLPSPCAQTKITLGAMSVIVLESTKVPMVTSK